MADITDELDDDTGLPDNRSVDERADDIVRKIKRCRKLADDSQSYWRQEARTDFAFLAGDQWSQSEKASLEDLRRVAVVFNRIEVTVESIAGHEVNNRQAVKYMPRQPAQDAQVNELLTHAADWARDNCDAEDEESDSFTDMLTCGIGVTETTLDYDNNPDGEITIGRVDPLLVRWDPAARKRNLVDAAWVQHDKRMTLADVRETWPEKADELAAMAATDSGNDDHDEEPHDATEAPYYKNDQRAEQVDKSLRTIVCHEWFDSVPYWRTVDPATGQMVELGEDEYERVQMAISAGLAMPAQFVKLKRRLYKVAYLCNGVLLEERESITQKGFTLNFMTGRRDRNRNSWYGIVRPMRDPQRFANKYLSQLEALIRSNAKGGLLVEEGAADNIRELEEKWAQQDSVITLNDGAIANQKILPKPVSPLPAGPERLLDYSVNAIRDVTGVNLESLGLADRNQPALLEVQRREAALTILAPLFNSLRRYRKVQGRVLADLIVRFISDGRLIRIVQGDGTEQSIPLMRLPDTMEYDVVVDSSSSAPDQKAKTFAVMSQLIPALEKSGFPTPPEILDYAPLPQSLVAKWKQAIQQRQSQPPPPPPEVLKAQIMAQVDLQKAQMSDAQKRQQAQMDAQLEVFKATLAAQTKAQTEQLYAAINEQSQIINAQANEQKAQADTLKVRMEGLAKMIDAITKMRVASEKAIEKGTRGPSVIALPMGDGGEMQAQALQQMAAAVQTLGQSINGPRAPLRVIRDASGQIAGVQ